MVMKKQRLCISKKNKHEGSVLITVLIVTGLFTLLLLQGIDNYQRNGRILIYTKNYYIARSLENMSLALLKEEEDSKKGTFTYKQGKVIYKATQKGYHFQTELTSGFVHQEEISQNKAL